MQVGIRYGRGVVNIDVPDQNLVAILDIQPSAPIADPEVAIWKALTAPIDSPSLTELAKGQQTACVVISDIARSVPNKLILLLILQTLEAGGIARGQITILVATGIHCPNFGAELEEMIEVEIVANYRILNHYLERLETHTDLGTTENSTPVLIDRTCVEADLKNTTALIEPHLMARYSGGRKAICPGLASIETMKIMYGPATLEHPKAAIGVLAGNPLHVEATEIARIAGVDFTLNVITIDTQRRLTGALAGDLETAHLGGAEFIEKQAKATVSEPADAVLTSCVNHRLDATFYQAVKSAIVALDVVKEGGSIVLYTECNQGIGSDLFTDLILKAKDLKQFVHDIFDFRNFVIDQWQLEELAKAAQKAGIYFYAKGISKDQQTDLFVEPLDTPQAGANECWRNVDQTLELLSFQTGLTYSPNQNRKN